METVSSVLPDTKIGLFLKILFCFVLLHLPTKCNLEMLASLTALALPMILHKTVKSQFFNVMANISENHDFGAYSKSLSLPMILAF